MFLVKREIADGWFLGLHGVGVNPVKALADWLLTRPQRRDVGVSVLTSTKEKKGKNSSQR